MKKYIVCLLFILLLLPCTASAAEKIGTVMETDIVTYIDASPIPSYNYQDYTYVIAEDLRNYGFTVEWNEAARTLSISRTPYVFTPYVGGFINEPKQARTYRVLYSVYTTDIQTDVNGEQITAYNIDGQTIINTDYLQAFGYCTYDNDARRYSVDILSKELEGCEEQTETDEYFQAVKKGLFENGELIYGISISERKTRYGIERTEVLGDFKNGRTVERLNSYIYNNEERLTYQTPEYNVYCATDPGYKYGLFLNSAVPKTPDGLEYRYLPTTGELYLIKEYTGGQPEPERFYGWLLQDGQQIYEGILSVDRFRLCIGNGYAGQSEDFAVLYAPGYSSQNGVIYYYVNSNENPYAYMCRDGVYYRGSVVNGVAHGTGVIQTGDGASDGGVHTLYTENGPIRVPMPQPGILYEGECKDGLPHGQGKLYSYGRLTFEGTWQNGKRIGHGREYASIGADYSYLLYDGNYVDDRREGEGVEYDQKGFANYEGVYVRFTGRWENGSWKYGKWYECDYNAATNTHVPYLYYEGEFNYDGEEQYGTHYRYYNEETGQYEVKTGWFVNWTLVREA